MFHSFGCNVKGPKKQREEKNDYNDSVHQPSPDSRRRVEWQYAKNQIHDGRHRRYEQYMFRIHSDIYPQILFEASPEQEIGFPAEYYDQQAQQYARKNSVQAEEPSQQHRHSDIDRRFDHRSPDVAEQTVGIDICLDRRPRQSDIQRCDHQAQRQVVQHVFRAYPQRNEGRRKHIDSETDRAAQ